MKTQKLGANSAFPRGENKGMSKRFYVACLAMQALIQKDFRANCFTKEIVKNAYDFADEMLIQENL